MQKIKSGFAQFETIIKNGQAYVRLESVSNVLNLSSSQARQLIADVFVACPSWGVGEGRWLYISMPALAVVCLVSRHPLAVDLYEFLKKEMMAIVKHSN